jgi:hypothetical protein
MMRGFATLSGCGRTGGEQATRQHLTLNGVASNLCAYEFTPVRGNDDRGLWLHCRQCDGRGHLSVECVAR